MSPAEFIPIQTVNLSQGESPVLSAAHEADIAARWRATLENNPDLFNGPIVCPVDAQVVDGACTIRWYHSDYAHYSYSRNSSASYWNWAPVGSLFVSVVFPTHDGGLVVGRMAPHTSAPGVVQLPGGGVSISADRTEISQHDVMTTAIEEADEEMGLSLDAKELRICGLIERRHPPDIGIVVATPPVSWHEIERAFSARREQECRAGIRSEFETVTVVRRDANLGQGVALGGGTPIDYLPAVVAALLGDGGVGA